MAEKDEVEREFNEIRRQLEEDADREIEELKDRYCPALPMGLHRHRIDPVYLHDLILILYNLCMQLHCPLRTTGEWFLGRLSTYALGI